MKLTKAGIQQKIEQAEEFKRDSKSNEAKWYWQGVIDGLQAALGH